MTVEYATSYPGQPNPDSRLTHYSYYTYYRSALLFLSTYYFSLY